MISPPFVCPQKLPESPIPRAVSLCMYCLWVHTLRGCAEVCMLGALWAPLQGRPTATYLRAHRRRGRHLSIMGALTATDMTRGLFPLHKTTTLFLSGSKDRHVPTGCSWQSQQKEWTQLASGSTAGKAECEAHRAHSRRGGGGTARWEVTNICWVPGTAANSLEMLPSSSELQAPLRTCWEVLLHLEPKQSHDHLSMGFSRHPRNWHIPPHLKYKDFKDGLTMRSSQKYI